MEHLKLYGLATVVALTVILGAVPAAYGYSSPARLGTAMNIAELGVTDMEEASLPYSAETISFSVTNCDIIDKDEYVYVKVDDLEPYTKAGEPALPMETFTVKLPKNARVVDVKVVSGSCKEIEGRLKIAPTAEPLAWMIKSGMKQKTEITRVPDEQVYALDSYLPGNAVSYDVGCDGDYNYVFVRMYPVQYNPQREKAVLITEAQVKVYYTEDAVVKTVSNGTSIAARNIILTPPELYSQAEDLKEFHEGDGTSTEVINTTWIYQNYDESPDPPYSGYNDSTNRGWDNIQGYNYSLAKRTIAFLNDSDAHPDLEYVTLLGNARLLPPSYYVHIRHYNSYDNWIPTDYFYGSPDFDLVPNYRVGRIPVNNSTEADHVVRKIVAWDATLNWDWFKNVSLAGGQPFGTEYYMGELIIADAINDESFNGMNIEKLYRTDCRFTVEEVLAAHSGGTGILYSITHGNGECIATENGDGPYGSGRICADDLLTLPESSKTPIVVSIACRNGAFDTNVMDGGVPLTFGEAVLLSNASGIAYIGGSRVNYGSPDFYIENGYLNTTKEPYMAGMLTNVFAAYHGGAVTLGDATKTAITAYVAENNFSDDINLVTLFEFTLLGDPALAIPEQQPGASYQQPVVSAASPDGELNNVPWYEVDAPIITSIATDSPGVATKRIVAPRDITVETVEDSTVGGMIDYSFSSPVRTEYLVRPSTDDGKEGWFYVRSLARTYVDVAGDATGLWNKSIGALGDELYISVNPVEDLDGDGLDDAMIRGESVPWFWFYGAMDLERSVTDRIFGSTPEIHDQHDQHDPRDRVADIFDENRIDQELRRPNSDVELIYDRFNTSRGQEIVASVFDENRTNPRSRRPDLSEKRLHDRFNASCGQELRERYDSRFQSLVSPSMHSEVDICRGYDGKEFWNESVNGTYCWIDTEDVGDIDCDGGTDFLVNTVAFDWEAETYSCSVAVRRGFDGTPLWEESVSGEGDGYASAYPVDDLNGDGIMDFIVRIETCDYETNTSSCSVAAKMGHNGTDIWSRSTSGAGYRKISASQAGCLTYDWIPDFVICTQIYDVDANTYSVSVTAIDGSDGVELWSESMSGTGAGWIDAEPVEDLNCDRTADILVNIDSYDEDANTHDCSVAAISGIDGVYLWEESGSGTGDGWLYADLIGDLDSDGGMDFLINFESSDRDANTFDSSLVALKGSDGTHFWDESISGTGIGWLDADSVEDLDSDGMADFLIEIEICDIDWAAHEIRSCDYGVIAISGSDGTHLWEESMSGIGDGWMWVDSRDLDGDNIPDFLINFESSDWDGNTFNSSLVALNGSDGTHFWDESISGTGIGWLDADSVEDLNCDGITDFLIEIEIYDMDWDTYEMLSYDCSVTAISGSDGTQLWEESMSGTGIGELYSNSVEDLDSDGITDFLISATIYDVDWDAEEILSYDCSVTAISGSDGTHLWEESASGTGAGEIQVDFCDLDYDDVSEFLICIESYDWDTNAYNCRIIAVNGSDGTHIWDTSVNGSGYGSVYAYPLDDLNCDGTMDILVDFRSYDIDWDAHEILSCDCSVIAVSGSDGMHLWEESVSGTGFGEMWVDFCDLDYDGVLEFLISTESCDRDANTYDFSLLVLNGSDGTHLWSDSKSGSGCGWFGADLVEDLNGDFRSDIIVYTSVYDEITDTYDCSVSAKRGCDGSDIWVESMSGTGDMTMGIYEIVDIDRDGVSDVVVESGEFVYKTILRYGMKAISGCDGHEIWTVDSNDYVDWSYRSGDFNGDGANEMVLTTSDSVCIASGAVPFPIKITIGDLNCDGNITTIDAAIALEIAAGSRPYDPAADIDRNGVVTSLDARMILAMAQKIQVSVNASEEVFDTFNVTIDIEDVVEMNCGQFDLSFDPDVVNVTGVYDGCIGDTPVPIAAWRFMDAGTIRVLFNLPGVTGVDGSGQITTISFEVTGSQGDTSVLDIFDGMLVNIHADVIPADWTDDVVSVGGVVT